MNVEEDRLAGETKKEDRKERKGESISYEALRGLVSLGRKPKVKTRMTRSVT